MRHYKDRAIVLKRKKFGEASNLITVFSKSHGKINILAKGSSKIKSKFLGHIEPLSLIEFSAVSGRSFEILTSSQIEKSFHLLKEDLRKVSYLNLICEALDSLTCEKQSNPKAFNLLLAIFSSKAFNLSPDLLVPFFLLNLLKLLGYAPHLDFCLKCKEKDFTETYFSFYWGGIICKDCKDHHFQKKISYNLVKVFKIFLIMPEYSDIDNYFEILDPKINSDLRKEALKIASDFFNFINEGKPNSLKFLEKTVF